METIREPRGHDGSTARAVMRPAAAAIAAVLLVVGLATTVGASSSNYEIVVSVSTEVRAAFGTVTVLETADVPPELVGKQCNVEAESENQTSVHPGNDLVVESESQVILSDVEAVPGGTVTAIESMLLGDQIVISLVMGPDTVFSAGIVVRVDCPPETTTSTTEQTTSTIDSSTTSTSDETTTTVASSTTTTADTTTTIDDTTTTTGADTTSTSGDTTTTIAASTTTTNQATSTTEESTTTTVEGSATTIVNTSTTIEDEVKGTEVLPFTGPEDSGLGLLALALTGVGLLVLLLGRSQVIPGGGVLLTGLCINCDLPAILMTPYGRMCERHTRRALDQDPELWMPRRLEAGS